MSKDIEIDKISEIDRTGIDECAIDGEPIKAAYRLKLGGMYVYICEQCFFSLADECEDKKGE